MKRFELVKIIFCTLLAILTVGLKADGNEIQILKNLEEI